MPLACFLGVALVALLFSASKLQRRGYPWADNVCHYAYGLCDEAQFLMFAAAFLALAAVARASLRQ